MDTMERYGRTREGHRLAPHKFTHDPALPGRLCTCGLPWHNNVHLASYAADRDDDDAMAGHGR
jgi:hypothetical protein